MVQAEAVVIAGLQGSQEKSNDNLLFNESIKMKIIVDNEQTKQTLIAICAAAGKTGDLNIMKAAVVIVESITIGKSKDEKDNVEMATPKK